MWVFSEKLDKRIYDFKLNDIYERLIICNSVCYYAKINENINISNSNMYHFIAYYFKLNKQIHKMIHYLKKGVELNDTYCMIYLGDWYRQEKDYNKMFELYNSAIDLGNYDVFRILSLFYIQDIQDIDKYSEMFKLCNKRAESGNLDEIYKLAGFYEYGFCIEKNYDIMIL